MNCLNSDETAVSVHEFSYGPLQNQKEMNQMEKTKAILYAFLAAVFYAVNVPISKVLLNNVGPTTMAALLYLGAGIGIGLLALINRKDREQSEPLAKKICRLSSA